MKAVWPVIATFNLGILYGFLITKYTMTMSLLCLLGLSFGVILGFAAIWNENIMEGR